MYSLNSNVCKTTYSLAELLKLTRKNLMYHFLQKPDAKKKKGK